MAGEHLERVEVASLDEWRVWLAAHHGQVDSIWLVRWKKECGPYLAYADVVDEALCWGWIDSLPRKLDEDRSMLLLSPRRADSAWSAVNKAKVKGLIAAGRMQPAGLAKIEAAKADGSWDRLNSVDALTVPDDLASALAAAGPDAAHNFAAFSPTSRRGILEWIVQAKRAATRAERVARTARLAQIGLRANFPEARGR
jgi:uncharacterized protein YdeI (YjbR/CyaY-like superfamily)